jgi:hypothetical protein
MQRIAQHVQGQYHNAHGQAGEDVQIGGVFQVGLKLEKVSYGAS